MLPMTPAGKTLGAILWVTATVLAGVPAPTGARTTLDILQDERLLGEAKRDIGQMPREELESFATFVVNCTAVEGDAAERGARCELARENYSIRYDRSRPLDIETAAVAATQSGWSFAKNLPKDSAPYKLASTDQSRANQVLYLFKAAVQGRFEVLIRK